jgi:hypothetical protein
MAKGISIHVGVNAVNPQHYRNVPILKAAEHDAKAMAELAGAAGFQVRAPLLGEKATVEAVTGKIKEAIAELDRGDILLITYSGHGGQMRDTDEDDEGEFDETWCLYDRQLIDDELYELWTLAGEGTRILVVSDSCYSGTVIRDGETVIGGGIFDDEEELAEDVPRSFSDPFADAARKGQSVRGLPPSTSREIFDRNAPMYMQAKRSAQSRSRAALKTRVLLLSASSDLQPAVEKDGHGVFTNALLEAWDSGVFTSYHDFHARIFTKIQKYQTPGYFGPEGTKKTFLTEPPFFIDDETSRSRKLHRYDRRRR